MRFRERILLGASGLILAISGARRFVHELSHGLPAVPAAAHHAGATVSTAYSYGYITGYETIVIITLVCGLALLAWCLRDIIRKRTKPAR